MATFTAIQCKKQSASSMRGVIDYVEQEEKSRWGDAWLVTGSDCVPQSAFIEMQMTKERFNKTDGTQFYHFVQSFSAEDDITPQEVNAIGLEFAQRQFPGFEVVIATHVDTGHLHNHMVVNSVSHKDGHKLHQSPGDLLAHRKVNDEICLAHGLRVLDECELRTKKKRMKPGEYQAGLRGDSWKLDLIQAINEALEYSITREDFITNMEMEGYEVSWSDTPVPPICCLSLRRQLPARQQSLTGPAASLLRFVQRNTSCKSSLIFARRAGIIDLPAPSRVLVVAPSLSCCPGRQGGGLVHSSCAKSRWTPRLIASALVIPWVMQ